MRFFLVFYLVFVCANSNSSEIKVNPGKYNDFYHLKFELKSGQYSLNEEMGFRADGMFEVYVAKEIFPINAPNCNSNIIIRMPGYGPAPKVRSLFSKLEKSESLTVVLELNPYFDIVKESPLELQLSYCNVFFRHRNGDYFDSL